MRRLTLALLLALIPSLAAAQTIPFPGGGGGGTVGPSAGFTTNCVVKATDAVTLGCGTLTDNGTTVSAGAGKVISSPKFTTTGTGTLVGYTLADTERVGVSTTGSAGYLEFRSGGAGYGIDVMPNSGGVNIAAMRFIQTFNETSGGGSSILLNGSMAPSSGTRSAALLHINPTINGTSSGTAYGIGVASKTNTLTGGTIKLASFGTTTTDLFTGYTPKFDILTTGVAFQAGVAFAALGTPANGSFTFCTDCDPPAAGATATCTSAGAATGAFAFRIGALWKCVG